MNQVVWNLFEILTTLLESVIIFWFLYWVSYGWKHSRLFVLLGIGANTVVISMCDLWKVAPMFKLLLCMICCSLFAIYIFNNDKKKIILTMVFYLACEVISETIVMGVLMGIYGYEATTVFLQQSAARILATLLGRMISIILLFFGVRILQRDKIYGRTKKEVLILILQTIAYMAVLVLSMELLRVYGNVSGILPYLFSGIAILCVSAYIVCFATVDRYFEAQMEKAERIREEEIVKRKEQYVEMKKESNEQIQRLYHDIKGHIFTMESMQSSNQTEMQHYLGEIKAFLQEFETFYDSGCDVLDMVLQEHQKRLIKKNIALDVSIAKPCLQSYGAFEICTICNNAIKNAEEALDQTTLTEKEIMLTIKPSKTGAEFLFSNASEMEPEKTSEGILKTHKKDKKLHGIGLRSIKAAAKKYDGTVNYEWKSGIFELYVRLN